MAKGTYWQRGESIDYVNSGDTKIDANTVILYGSRIGIAGADIPAGEKGSLLVEGSRVFVRAVTKKTEEEDAEVTLQLENVIPLEDAMFYNTSKLQVNLFENDMKPDACKKLHRLFTRHSKPPREPDPAKTESGGSPGANAKTNPTGKTSGNAGSSDTDMLQVNLFETGSRPPANPFASASEEEPKPPVSEDPGAATDPQTVSPQDGQTVSPQKQSPAAAEPEAKEPEKRAKPRPKADPVPVLICAATKDRLAAFIELPQSVRVYISKGLLNDLDTLLGENRYTIKPSDDVPQPRRPWRRDKEKESGPEPATA